MSNPTPKLENKGSLITYKEGDKDCCLGYLMPFEGHGVYDANFGKVDVTPEQAKTHNAELSKALLTGLDTTCQVGQGNVFYYIATPTPKVATFDGVLVSDALTFSTPSSFRFTRNGRQFKGRVPLKNRGQDVFVVRVA